MKDDMSLRFINSKSIKEFFKPYDSPFLNLTNILSPKNFQEKPYESLGNFTKFKKRVIGII